MKTINLKIILKTLFLAALIAGTLVIARQQREMPYQHNTGFVFGTVYNVTYQFDKDLQKEIEAELKKVDNSLSTFNKQSVISRINRNENVEVDDLFADVFNLSRKISEDTDGAFDITVAPLVNVWGFGFKNDTKPTKQVVDSLKQIIGYKKVSLQGRRVVKADKRLMLDCGAIAKGYGTDAVSRLLKSKGVENFMVEIGGEIVVKGLNNRREPWKIGVTKPSDDSLNVDNELQTILNITDKAMATSGNYRNFYYKDGRKYAHTINPNTGYPVQHNILSATVIADNCATADAYATAFMVLGFDKAKAVLDKNPRLMAYFILSDEGGKNRVWFSPKLKSKISE